MKISDKIDVRFVSWKQNISEGNERRAKKIQRYIPYLWLGFKFVKSAHSTQYQSNSQADNFS